MCLIEDAEQAERYRAHHGDCGKQQVGSLGDFVEDVGYEHPQQNADQAGSDQYKADSLAGLCGRQAVDALVERGAPGGVRTGREGHRRHAEGIENKGLGLDELEIIAHAGTGGLDFGSRDLRCAAARVADDQRGQSGQESR